MKISNLARSAEIDALTALLNVGGAGTIVFRTGTAPTNTTDADTGTLVGTSTFSSTSFGAASSGVATANSIANATAAATATPGYFRFKNNAGTVIAQGTVGISGTDAIFNSVTWQSGGTIAITAITITQPAGT